ncbi:DUF1330 domain-containing protein [Marinagarivorans cellulosilyticus]|uniref:DUF1330 domain-containing protein n=1 Tax=Marinagarivorans cellulosilyticus TaxID=2721545 RepID=A0AAN2BII5_9GAMM|nr:DUF1330 domain-containing protein [Marinagarivorans cellulosilyticus]BCD95899.1 hypothetical protein MARGE09_P0098 [Marinagarivorans cellulosilyticus]
MKAYLILDLTIHHLEKFLHYAEVIPAYIAKHQGKYIVKGVEPTVMEGDWQPSRVVVLEFPSKEHAQSFLSDPEAQPLFALRHSSTTSHVILVEGCEPAV